MLIDRKFVGLHANFVGVDDEEIGVMATEHLIERGCRRIAHIRGPEVSTAVGRHEGYRRALAMHGMVSMPGHLVVGKSTDDVSGYAAMQQLLQLVPPPDGVFCFNDPIALGAIKAILEAGLRVPEDFAVIGCGNVRYADMLKVPLSSIDQDIAAIGDHAAKLALSLISAKSPVRPESILVPPKLVARDSTRPPG